MTTINDVAPMFSKDLSEKPQRISDNELVPLTVVVTIKDLDGNDIEREIIQWENVRHHIKRFWNPLWFGEQLYILDPCLNFYREDKGDIVRCIQVCLQVRGFNAKSKTVDGAIDLICNHVSTYPFGNTRGCLNFSNGILDTTTMKIVEPNDGVLFDYVIATPYIHWDDTPELDAFLKIYSDAGREVISVLAKALWQRCNLSPIKEITVFYGDKDSGKTSAAELIQATLDGDLLLQRNTSRKLLGDLLQRFGYQALEHKLFNLGDDLPDQFIKNAGKINELVGSIHHEIEHKCVDSYSGVITAYNLFTTNNLPPMDDDDFVLWSKIRLVRFDSKLERGTPVEPLYTIIIKMQLLYRAVELMQSWSTTPYKNTQSSEEVRRIWHEASTDVDLFMSTRIIFETQRTLPLEEIKKEYERWCVVNGRHIYMKYLTKRLQPYLRRTATGNAYCVAIAAEVEPESFMTPGQETLQTS